MNCSRESAPSEAGSTPQELPRGFLAHGLTKSSERCAYRVFSRFSREECLTSSNGLRGSRIITNKDVLDPRPGSYAASKHRVEPLVRRLVGDPKGESVTRAIAAAEIADAPDATARVAATGNMAC